jgi:DNA polymerase-3 subunit alpha (Gram-positive type)
MRDRVVYFDLETGGLDPKIHPVIQFAGCATEDFEIVEELEVKLTFDLALCEGDALDLNSYDLEVWEESAFAPLTAVCMISAFLRRHATIDMVSKKGAPWHACQLAGHNAASFDFPFLRELFRQQDEFLIGSFLVLDTMQLAMWRAQIESDQRIKKFKLGTLCNFYGVEIGGAHDALADARATVELARNITEILKGERA